MKREQGHGKAIVHKLEEILLSEGMTKLALAVLLNNQPAGKFWRSLGFRPTKRNHCSNESKRKSRFFLTKKFLFTQDQGTSESIFNKQNVS